MIFQTKTLQQNAFKFVLHSKRAEKRFTLGKYLLGKGEMKFVPCKRVTF